MKKTEIWVGVLWHSERRWAVFDYVKIFDRKVDAEQWAQSITKSCATIGPFSSESIYIGKIPTDVDYLRNEAQNGNEK